MILQVRLELTDEEVKQLAYKARHYLRVNPRVRWRKCEYAEAARVAVGEIITSHLDDLRTTEERD